MCLPGAFRRKGWVLYVLALLLAGSGQAQGFTNGGLFDPTNPLTALRQRATAAAASATLLPLEGAVEAEAYRVGPGDVFGLTIGGPEPLALSVPVSADGYLALPDAGSVPVAGLTLAVARDQALEALRRVYRNVPLTVSLAQPRQFYVHVSGAVPLPGRYLALPVARVSSVLEQAFADTLRRAVSHPDFRPSLRNLRLIRKDGSEVLLDLLRYFTTGDTQHNPYLLDGDVVQVPAYDPRFASVFVDGAVPYPGAYDHRVGDTVADVLLLAMGHAGVTTPVRVRRPRADGQVETQEVDPARFADTPLQPMDQVYVPMDRLPGGTVVVEGYVRYPGTYPIVEGRTTLQDLVQQAGGLRPEALARGAYLERLALPEPGVRLHKQHRFEPGIDRPELLRPDTAAILQTLRLSEFDFLSRAYFTQELLIQNRVSANLEATLAAGAPPVYLRDGDRLVVPRDDQTVYVFGQVNRPGYVPYVSGQDGRGYLEAAGGIGVLAAEVYLIEVGTGRYLPLDQATVRSGDLIFVDRKTDLATNPELQRLVLEENRTRADARIRIAQTVLQTVGTVASLVALIVTLTR